MFPLLASRNKFAGTPMEATLDSPITKEDLEKCSYILFHGKRIAESFGQDNL
jgi:hypothetical protein